MDEREEMLARAWEMVLKINTTLPATARHRVDAAIYNIMVDFAQTEIKQAVDDAISAERVRVRELIEGLQSSSSLAWMEYEGDHIGKTAEGSYPQFHAWVTALSNLTVKLEKL